MNALIFVGNPDSRPKSISTILSDYLRDKLVAKGVEVTIFNLNDSSIPLLDLKRKDIPDSVKQMTEQFLAADLHFWLSPLYHGSIPGVMKNCLDWLEITAQLPKPYLTDKKVGLICWADGSQALNGIATMENIVKSLRAWSIPYTLPIIKKDFTDPVKTEEVVPYYSERLDRLIHIALSRQINTIDM